MGVFGAFCEVKAHPFGSLAFVHQTSSYVFLKYNVGHTGEIEKHYNKQDKKNKLTRGVGI